MSSVTEWIVREYFEQRDYLVSQPRKYIGPGSHQPGREEPELLVFNPAVRRVVVPEEILWNGNALHQIPVAMIGVRGWHTQRFSAARMGALPELLQFTSSRVMEETTRRLGGMKPVKILCIPRLPASPALRDDALRLLRERGIDGVILFRTILDELIAMVDERRHYEKSDLLQILRLLKTHGLLGDGQMDLFTRRRRVSGARKAASGKAVRKPAKPNSADKS